MATVVNVQDAKTRLSELLRRVEAGEEVLIARAGTPIARLEAMSPPARRFDQPLLSGLPAIATDALFDGMTEIDIADWEEEHSDDPLAAVEIPAVEIPAIEIADRSAHHA